MTLQSAIEKFPIVDEHKGSQWRHMSCLDANMAGKFYTFEVEIQFYKHTGKAEVVLRMEEPMPGDRERFYCNKIAREITRRFAEGYAIRSLGRAVKLTWAHPLNQSDDRFVFVLEDKQEEGV